MEKEKAQNVVTGQVGVSARKKVKDAFIKSDGKTITNYAVFDVLIPSIKRIIYDIVTKTFGMALFNNDKNISNGSTLGSNGYANQYQQVIYRASDVSYRPYNSAPPARPSTNYAPVGFDYESFVFENRGDIEAVLNQLTDMIEKYGVATVGDLYDSVGRTAPYTAENYGWKTMNGCEPVICSGGWRLKMTRPSPTK